MHLAFWIKLQKTISATNKRAKLHEFNIFLTVWLTFKSANTPLTLKNTAHNTVFLLAGLKFTSWRFSLIVLFVIFTKTNYNNPRQQKYPTVVLNIIAATFKQNLWDFFNSELTFCWLNSESESTFRKITALRIAA